MFRITGHTCHTFALEEVLIMAATNAEITRLTLAGHVRATRTRHSRHSLGTVVRKAQQL